MLSGIFSCFLERSARRDRRRWDDATQALSDKTLEGQMMLGDGLAEGERTARETPTVTLQSDRGPRASITATSQDASHALGRDTPAPVPDVVANTLALAPS